MKKLIVVFCVIFAAFSMISCKQASAGSEEPANVFVGTWKTDSWILNDTENPDNPYNGQIIYFTVTFDNLMKFSHAVYANGTTVEHASGTYKIIPSLPNQLPIPDYTCEVTLDPGSAYCPLLWMITKGVLENHKTALKYNKQ